MRLPAPRRCDARYVPEFSGLQWWYKLTFDRWHPVFTTWGLLQKQGGTWCGPVSVVPMIDPVGLEKIT